jgi:DNA-directed RNA polymerase subunit M/transcription elongation factor TFIIS
LWIAQADVHRKVLLRACRNCEYEEDATAGLVYRNDLLTISKYVARRPAEAAPCSWGIGARLLTGLLIALTLVPRARREQPGETQDLDTDPTLPRSSIPCPHCGQDEAVFYQDQSKRFEVRLRPGAARRFRDAAR